MAGGASVGRRVQTSPEADNKHTMYVCSMYTGTENNGEHVTWLQASVRREWSRVEKSTMIFLLCYLYSTYALRAVTLVY